MNHETELQKAILGYLKLKGYHAWRFPMGGILRGNRILTKNHLSGFPDIFGICKNRRGVLLVIEVKTLKGKLEDHQKKWLDLLNDLGVVTMVASSIAEVAEVLKKHDRVL